MIFIKTNKNLLWEELVEIDWDTLDDAELDSET